MRLFLFCAALSLMVGLASATAAWADFDTSPRWSGVPGDAILTYGFDDGAPAPDAQSPDPLRVFTFDFSPTAPVPNTTNDPGFHAVGVNDGFFSDPSNPDPSTFIHYVPSGLPDGTKLRIDILSNLRYWNGTDLGALPNSESLSMTVGSTFTTINSAGVTPASFTIGKVGPPSFDDEELHIHASTQLTGPGGGDPTDGVYGFMADFRLLNSDNTSFTNAGTSLPFWVLFDHSSPDGTIDVVASFAESTLVPEPSAGWLAVIGGMLMFGFCFHRRRAVAAV